MQASGKKISKLTQTGDQTPVTALVVVGLVALVALVAASIALAKSRKR